nr:haloacid dehalogenase-like hydrolase [Micromonospora sp. DSM 115978]
MVSELQMSEVQASELQPLVGGRRGAFFDVDDTLLARNSMASFLRFHFAAAGRPAAEYDAVAGRLRWLVGWGTSREEVVRTYYASYAGQPVADVAAQGRDWFAQEERRGELFVAESLAAFQEHRRAGDLTVLVSGSFAAACSRSGSACSASRRWRARWRRRCLRCSSPGRCRVSVSYTNLTLPTKRRV